VLGLATVLLGLDLQGWITLIAGVLLALITLYGLRPTASTPDMTMSTSFGGQPSGLISKSEFLSSLPRWRRWLSRLNWHPVVEYEIREIEFERRKIAFEQREIEHEKRMQQLESEIAQIEKENEQLAELNAKLVAILASP
jgi:hypothetical protein